MPCRTQGLLLSVGDKFADAQSFLRLWRNEVLRVLHDRLISPEDKKVLCDRLAELVEHRFPAQAQHALATPILFGDFK